MQENFTIIIEPEKPANASVIWLHGLAADANDFLPVVDQFIFPDNLNIRFIFPNAPVRPITLNGGISMQGWYDIIGIGPDYEEDKEGIEASQQIVEDLIEKECEKGIATDRIILVGFSQGGAVALHTGIRYTQQLAAVLALSTYLPLRQNIEQEICNLQKTTPIVFMHGSKDLVVPIGFAQHSYDRLNEFELNVKWFEYDMQHTVCLEQINDINKLIVDLLI